MESQKKEAFILYDSDGEIVAHFDTLVAAKLCAEYDGIFNNYDLKMVEGLVEGNVRLFNENTGERKGFIEKIYLLSVENVEETVTHFKVKEAQRAAEKVVNDEQS